MIFRRVEPSNDYRSLRFLSGEGCWELGLSPYQYGIRIRMGSTARPPSVIDFCLGYDTSIYSPVLLAVMQQLEGLDESATAQEIDSLFPWAGTRPDPAIHLKALLHPFRQGLMPGELAAEEGKAFGHPNPSAPSSRHLA